MNRKYTFKHATREDFNAPNNNYGESDHIIVEPPYDFMDWLNDSGVQAEKDGNTYYILDTDGDRTGEAFFIVDECDTAEGWIN